MTKTVTGFPGINGKRADGQLVIGVIPQFDGSRYASGNCGAASEAMRDVAQRLGRKPSKGSPWYPTGASIRSRTGDTSGGLMPSQTQKVSRDVYGIPTPAARVETWSHVLERLWAGQTVDLLVKYRPISDAGHSGSPGFTGNHRGLLGGVRKLDNGGVQVLWRDPLYDGRRSGIPRGPEWIDNDVLRRAGEQLDIVPGVTVRERYGPGRVYCIPTTTAYDPSPPPPPAPNPTPDAPPTSEVNRMIASADITTARVQTLAKGQPVYRHPGGPLVTRMSMEGKVGYIGHAGGQWGAVLVTTGRPYADGKPRPTVCYVPLAAGPIADR